jgi:hypothetical protein
MAFPAWLKALSGSVFPLCPVRPAVASWHSSATTGQNVLGITEARPDLPHPGDAYAVDDTVAVCEVGVIGVLLGANVTAGAQARWNTANSTWTGAAQSATVVTIPGAQFDEAGTSGDVGVVRYRRPVPSLLGFGVINHARI